MEFNRTRMASKSNSIARKARAKAEADFATWLMMAKLGSFDDLPSNAQEVLTNYRTRSDRMSETESKTLAVRELYGRYYTELGGSGPAPELEARSASTDENVVRFQKPSKPQSQPLAARGSTQPRTRRPVPALLIFAGMVAVIVAFKLLTN
jgi:hypothetical protein